MSVTGNGVGVVRYGESLGFIAKLGIFLLAAVLVLGCAAGNHRGDQVGRLDDRILVEDVPFYPDDRYWCGPATLTALLNYHGAEASLDNVADKIYSESAQGTAPFDMVWYAEKLGYEVIEERGDMASINKWLKRDHPIIVFTDIGNLFYSVHHYMVVIGMSENHVIVNSGEVQHKIVARETFQFGWAKRDNWMMVIR